MNKVTKIILLVILAISWMFVIFKLSGMSSKKSNGKSTDIISVFIEDTLDITNDYGITSSHPSEQKLARASELINAPMRKVIHATVYFALAFFIMVLLNVIFDHKKYILSFILALIISIIFAATDEFHQIFVSGRTGQILDVCIDSAGAFLGLLFYTTYHIIYKIGYQKGLEEDRKE